MTALFGDPRASFRYGKIKYGSPAITIDFPDPLEYVTPPQQYSNGINVSEAGLREVLHIRRDDLLGVRSGLLTPELAQQLRWFVEDHAGKGKQFEYILDRFTGSCWCFEGTRRDQNGLALTLNGGGSETYAEATNGKGIVLSGSQYLSVLLAQASAGTPTGFDDPLLHTEGVIVVDFKPAFAGNDSATHRMIDTSSSGANRLYVEKDVFNSLVFGIVDGASANKQIGVAVSWSANSRVQIVASWSATGTLKAWYAAGGGAFIELTIGAGAGTGILGALPTTLYIGAENDGSPLALGTYDTVAIFKRAFPNPLLLADYRPVFRNYLLRAELQEPIFEPQRPILARELYTWAATVRDGKG